MDKCCYTQVNEKFSKSNKVCARKEICTQSQMKRNFSLRVFPGAEGQGHVTRVMGNLHIT